MCLDSAKPSQRGAYLVVMGDYLVAQDLAESIEYYDPSADVIVRHTLHEAVEAVELAEQIVVAFVAEAPGRYLASPIAGLLSKRGARIVLIGDEAEAQGESGGWQVLFRPFSMSVVLALLVGPARV